MNSKPTIVNKGESPGVLSIPQPIPIPVNKEVESDE